MKFIKHLTIIFVMGIIYFYIEGWVRWSTGSMIGFHVANMSQSKVSLTGWSSQWMTLCGGLSGFFIGLFNEGKMKKLPIIIQALLGVLIVIWPLELLFGLILNVHFGLGIWDYSTVPLNIMGQITFTFLPKFLFVSLFAIWIDDVLRHWILGEARPAPIYMYLKNTILLKGTPT